MGVDSAGDGSDEGGATTTTTTTDDASSRSSSSDDSSGAPPAVCGDGILDATELCDDGNLDDGDGCDPECRPPGTQLWEAVLPRMTMCPRLAALDDGGVAVIGNEDLRLPTRIPHIVVIDGDGGMRWAVEGGHGEHDWIKDIVAEPGGFVVVGNGDVVSVGEEYTGWMQRWSADGTMEAESIRGADEPGEHMWEIERRDAASYWIVAENDVLSPDVLLSRTFDAFPTSQTWLEQGANEVFLARAPEEGAYVASDGNVGTLFRVDREGEVLWTLQYDAPAGWASYPTALASTVSGEAIVTGTDQGDPDLQWIRRFDISGTELWRTTIEVSAVASDDFPRHVAVGGDASFVIGESQTETGNPGFLVEYDAEGVELWQTLWWSGGEGLNAMPCDVVVTADGTVVVAGAAFVAGVSPDTYWLRAFTP